jgi:hypothetical protein
MHTTKSCKQNSTVDPGCFFCGGPYESSLIYECGNNAELTAAVDMCAPCWQAFEDDEDGFKERHAKDFETIENELAR